MRNLLSLPLVLLLASTAAIGRDSPSVDLDAKFASRVEGLVPGPALTCINQRPPTSIEAIGPRLLYKVSRKLTYVNQTAGGCENVARGDTLVTRSFSSRLCSGDIAETVDLRGGGIPTGGCALGEFIPYAKP